MGIIMNNELILSILKLALDSKEKTTCEPESPEVKMIGRDVIVRTYSAGCWFGVLLEKEGKEVIIGDARRMWRWHAEKGISLSCCAIHGIKEDQSKIVEAVGSVWLEAIEIIPCTIEASKSIRGAENVEAE